MKHIIVEAILTPVLIVLFKNVEIGILVAFSIGLLKECIDEIFKRLGIEFWFIKGTGFDYKDILRNIVGIFAGLVIFWIMAIISVIV